ncbi:hypothetical protein ACHHYP_07021 [Achlya hypogyna]|uniref:Ion transport domain-containing protein n=1 Tax=Achlya hypogyna TaxID=1202772 RepID=A0A1V9YR56_ACHHY|nr:hypothetical protein ACHHYP_07021 [Achlya hypogyna]
MHYISGAADGATHRYYNRQDTVGVMIEMTPSEPSTTYMVTRTPMSASGYSQFDDHDDVAKPLPQSQRFHEDLEAGRPTFRHTTSLAREAAKAEKIREIETIAANLDACKDDVSLIGSAFRTNVRKSVLYKLLHQDASAELSPFDVDAIEDEKKQLLRHPVMRLIVLLKWRAFGLRGYCEQLFMHLLLLLTFTVSLGLTLKVTKDGQGNSTIVHSKSFNNFNSFEDDNSGSGSTFDFGSDHMDEYDFTSFTSSDDPDVQFKQMAYFWLVAAPLLLLSLIATRFMTWKNKSTWACVMLVVGGAAATAILLNKEALFGFCKSKAWEILNNCLLGLSALYFCIFELRELAADITDHQVRLSGDSILYWRCVHVPCHFFRSIFDLVRGKTPSPYFESYWNRIQLPTFFFVVVYVLCEYTAPFSDEMRVYAGIPALFLLYVMCVQYLEVFQAVGYLLPMMRHMLTDVFRYLAFYFPIQCAYACAYYLLFKSQLGNLKPYEPVKNFSSTFATTLRGIFPNVNLGQNNTYANDLLTILKTKDTSDMFQGYETVPKSFVTTYLVSFGQINIEPFDQLESTTASILGYILLLTHATIVIVMLLNVLIAMMDKTMGAYMDEAKVEACVTFAECVLRMEKMSKQETSEAYWQQLDMSEVQVLYENIVRADSHEKSNDDAVLKAIAELSATVKSLQMDKKYTSKQ